jgi:tetratricopeptide (TPR) repeat protein
MDPSFQPASGLRRACGSFRFVPVYGLIILIVAGGPANTSHGADVLGCGQLTNAYGPFDYNDAAARRDSIPIVEKFHFTPNVEQLQRGESGTLMSDLDYTLRAVPNHPRALMALVQYRARGGSPEKFLPAECYFERALRFRPEDGVVHMIQGIFLQRLGRLEEAVKAGERAVELLPESAEAHYNLGLLYAQLKRYPQARSAAVRAYELGYPLPGLRNKLQRAGQWNPDASVTSQAAGSTGTPQESNSSD